MTQPQVEQDQYGPRDGVDELHDKNDVERIEAFSLLLEQNPAIASRALLVLTERYGVDAALTSVLLDWLVGALGEAFARLQILETQIFAGKAARVHVEGDTVVRGGIILPGG